MLKLKRIRPPHAGRGRARQGRGFLSGPHQAWRLALGLHPASWTQRLVPRPLLSSPNQVVPSQLSFADTELTWVVSPTRRAEPTAGGSVGPLLGRAWRERLGSPWFCLSCASGPRKLRLLPSVSEFTVFLWD